ncbi:hypothetical protein GCK72_005420 [Caenorhabditis remanei]|uniref:Uncharacterized protein n=1 Tax=Caenorhabditis remanei TaxID=31234 RepID=A0A6A5HCH4_CAERE|nr:hypothetical protein GCK72_005420 [Caenorhabditis remanei]KAF1765468.1 hypothetical protein GCK72_005420 [Caenorhabditis remanei]
MSTRLESETTYPQENPNERQNVSVDAHNEMTTSNVELIPASRLHSLALVRSDYEEKKKKKMLTAYQLKRDEKKERAVPAFSQKLIISLNRRMNEAGEWGAKVKFRNGIQFMSNTEKRRLHICIALTSSRKMEEKKKKTSFRNMQIVIQNSWEKKREKLEKNREDMHFKSTWIMIGKLQSLSFGK